jgi:mannose-6-phosphate isomerase-like protein (cupin superfamily)
MNMKRTVKDADMISGEGFAGGHGHMDVAVVLGKDPDIADIKGHTDDFDSGILFLNWCSLAEGALCGAHPHNVDEEVYYIMKGRGKMTITNPDGTVEVFEAGPDEAIKMKWGSTHSFENIGKGDCVFLAICGNVKYRYPEGK